MGSTYKTNSVRSGETTRPLRRQHGSNNNALYFHVVSCFLSIVCLRSFSPLRFVRVFRLHRFAAQSGTAVSAFRVLRSLSASDELTSSFALITLYVLVLLVLWMHGLPALGHWPSDLSSWLSKEMLRPAHVSSMSSSRTCWRGHSIQTWYSLVWTRTLTVPQTNTPLRQTSPSRWVLGQLHKGLYHGARQSTRPRPMAGLLRLQGHRL